MNDFELTIPDLYRASNYTFWTLQKWFYINAMTACTSNQLAYI